MYICPVADHPEQPETTDPDAQGITRRTFVATGVAVGASVVWTSPFADAAVGKILESGSVTGTTGATGETGPATSTSTSTSTATSTGSTGTTLTGPTGTTEQTEHFQFPFFREVGQDGVLAMTAFLAGPGKLHVTATVTTGASGVKGVLSAALKHTKYATYTKVAHHRGLVHARLHPTKKGAAVFARHRHRHQSLHVKVTATFTPTGGSTHTHTHTLTLKP